MSSTFGRISSVFVDPDRNGVYVNVVTGPNKEPRMMPFTGIQKGAWAVPEEGDMVEVHKVGGQRVARFPATPPEHTIPTNLSEGDLCFSMNGGTKLHFSKQADGTFNVDIEADGDISVTTTGNVTVNGKVTVNGQDLPYQNHTHEVTLSDGSTATSTTPIEDGTGV